MAPFISFSDYFRRAPSVQMFKQCSFFSLTPFHWLADTQCLLTDVRYAVNEYGWSCPSVHLPSGPTGSECWGSSTRGWKELENELDVSETVIFLCSLLVKRSRRWFGLPVKGDKFCVSKIAHFHWAAAFPSMHCAEGQENTADKTEHINANI